MNIYRVEDFGGVEVTTAGLVGGDGVDLVLKRPGRRSVTVQLSVENADRIAGCIRLAAQESKADAGRAR